MAEARGKFEWGQTSCLMALVANMFRDPKKSKPVKPEVFNPYFQKPKPKVHVNIAQLKQIMTNPERMVFHGRSKR